MRRPDRTDPEEWNGVRRRRPRDRDDTAPAGGGMAAGFVIGCGTVVLFGAAGFGLIWFLAADRPVPDQPVAVNAPALPPAAAPALPMPAAPALPAPPPPDEYAAMGQPAVVGPVAVRVTAAQAGKVTGTATVTRGTWISLSNYLAVTVEVENRSEKAVRFTRWDGGRAADATLTIDRNRTLSRPRINFGERADGALAGDTTIPPGGRVSDVYLFEDPPTLVTDGRLILDAGRVGEQGTFKLRVRWSVVRRDPRYNPRQ